MKQSINRSEGEYHGFDGMCLLEGFSVEVMFGEVSNHKPGNLVSL